MKENEAKLKQLQKELDEQRMKDHMTMNDARHEYYRTHGEKDLSYEDWSKLSKEEKDELEKKKKEEPKSDTKSVRESISMEEARRDEREEFKTKPQKDLEPYRYNVRKVKDNVLAVGWLEPNQDFPKGDVPEGFLKKLAKLEEVNFTKGLHTCPFCGKERGSYEIEVKDNGITYMAPVLIKHYVKEHNYQPPKEYIDAVMKTKDVQPRIDRPMSRYK